jgi:cysteine desulfurase
MTASTYLDNLATTPVSPEVLHAMLPWFSERFGNPSSSSHSYGWEAAEAVQRAREQVAELIGAARSSEIVFTSGATESNNTVVSAVACERSGAPRHVILSAIEHPSLLTPCASLDPGVVSVTLVRPGPGGHVSPRAVAQALNPNTFMISIMLANNEVGTLQPVARIAQLARAHGALLHVDAAQAVGKIDIDVQRLGVDLLSLSGHKFNGPKGIGALYIRAGGAARELSPLLRGGGQQEGRRAGTLPVPLIVGMGVASSLAHERGRQDARRIVELTARLSALLSAGVPGILFNGTPPLLPGCLNFSVPGIVADALIAETPSLAFSTGSACSSHHEEGSYVLRALGLGDERIAGSMRIGIGRDNTLEEIQDAGELLVRAVNRLRSRSVHRERAERSR